MTPDRESRLEAALEALLAEVVNMREDYPAEAWRFSDEAIANAESAMELPQSVANRASILGTVEFSYSDSDTKCACCPDGRHAYGRCVRLDDWESPAPAHLPRDPDRFVRDFAAKHEHVGKRVKISVEILD